jgi:hypothetical protein
MFTFYISEPSTAIFKTDPARPLIIYAKAGVYHVQRVNNASETKVKFPVKGLFCCAIKPLKIEKGINKPNRLDMPMPDRPYNEESFKVKFNPDLKGTPARIFYELGLCEVGPAFYSFPLQWQKFILEHEKGHLHYSEEKNADRFALNRFMQSGFNYSQAVYSLENVLHRSEENISRFNTLLNTIKNEN